ncbi:bifunctional homocysteine S-methyltransferase/methylenetetrahydrofolate reductase [Anaerolineales bacterium]
MSLSFAERLTMEGVILADGGMATMLQELNPAGIYSCFEALNLSAAETVKKIHLAYLKAGSEMIETNTYGANRFKLAEHGLAGQVQAINEAGVECARQARTEAGDADRYIIGAIGPLGVKIKPDGSVTREEAAEAFTKQAQYLIQAGVDGLILETFADHNELLLAITAIRSQYPDIVIIAQATFSRDNLSYSGFSPARIADALYQSGASVMGVNCGSGPAQISQIAQSMHQAVPSLALSVMPNAGFPEMVGGRTLYPAEADYFGDYALIFRAKGAKIIGGCCGTTPDHIASMRQALDGNQAKQFDIQVLDPLLEDDASPVAEDTELAKRLRDKKFTVTVEISPPRSYTAENLLASARSLRDAGAVILDVADTPAAKMKMSAWAVCHLLQSRLGIESVLHFPTRGRNLLRIQGDLLAAHALDLRNLFVTMGDPTRIGDYPDATDSFDIAPSNLIAVIKQQMNQGEDMSGKSIGKATNFTVGCALNMGAEDLERELKLFRKKQQAGADFALGQALYDAHKLDHFLKFYEEFEGKPFDFPVLLGVIPLYSINHARFLHNEVPGISIPAGIFKRLEAAGEENAAREGVQIAKELMRDMKDKVAGAYVIPSFGRYHLAAEVVDDIVYGA